MTLADDSRRAVLRGHRGWVTGLCTVTVAGRPTLASAGDDGTVRIWDLSQASLPGREGNVTSLCPVTVSGQELLAGTWSDNTIRICDPALANRVAFCKVTRVRSTACAPGHRGRTARPGQRGQRQHGPDLGRLHRSAPADDSDALSGARGQLGSRSAGHLGLSRS
jgi:WD domain, G-beta repeat